MNCYRCGGIMAYEKFYALYEHFFGWRCIVCGEILDQVILENQQTSGGEPNDKKQNRQYPVNTGKEKLEK